MAYTPELSQRSSSVLRRLAWALDIPMTKAMERVIEHITMIVDNKKVCSKCRDKTKCNTCVFKQNNKKGE